MMDEKLRLDIYRKMILSRRLEERIAELIKSGQAGGFMRFPGVGQEALQVAAIAALRRDYRCMRIAGSPTGWRAGSRSIGYCATSLARKVVPTRAVAA